MPLLLLFPLLPPLLFALCASSVLIPSTCSSSLSCTSAINAAIAACGGAPCSVSLEAGRYLLEGAEYGPRITINNARGLTISGVGDGTVLISNISNVFSMSASSDVTFASFAVDSERLPFTYGQVTATNATHSTVTFDATGAYRIELARHPWLARAQGVISYDPVKQRFAKGSDIYALDAPIPITFTSPAGAAARLDIATALILNDWVVIRHQTYAYNAFSVSRSTNTAWRNVTLWSVAGMGILTDQCSGIDIESLRIEKRDGRPMSITADGVHFSNTRGGAIALRHCLLEGQGDDGLNAPTLFQYIISLGATSFQVGGRDTTGAAAPLFAAGDTVNFFSRTTMLPRGTAVVASIGANNTVELTSPLPPGVAVYDSVNDAGQYAATLEVTDCVFRNNRARGALLKQSNVLCARNVFEGMTLSAAKTETDSCYWQEGHPVANWSFTDNRIAEVNLWGGLADIVIDNDVAVFKSGVPTTTCVPYEGAAPGAAVQRGVNISGNIVTQSSGMSAIAVYSADGVELRGNVITREAGAPTPAIDLQGFGVVGAVLAGNVCDGRACVEEGFGA